jgi:hypothetical protein
MAATTDFCAMCWIEGRRIPVDRVAGRASVPRTHRGHHEQARRSADVSFVGPSIARPAPGAAPFAGHLVLDFAMRTKMVEPIAIATGLTAGQVLGEARNFDEMVEIFSATRQRIGLSNAHTDELANVAHGGADKVLGPTRAKQLGPLTFAALNWAFAVKWICVVDADQLAVMEQYWKDRQRQVSHVRPEPVRVSKKILERAKPILLKELGAKLALALGDDVGQLLLGMKPETGIPASTSAPALRPDEDEKGLSTVDTPSGRQEIIVKSEPAPPPRTPAPGRAHLRIVRTKRGSKYG